MSRISAKVEPHFYQLEPELVLRATENAGFLPTGEFSQLNSYENRVFDIRLEQENFSHRLLDDTTANPVHRIIAKFYRPGRWSVQALREEHEFLNDLKKEGLPAVAPLIQRNGSSLSEINGMQVAFFPKVLGRMPEEFLAGDLQKVGKTLAHIHNIGARKKFKARPELAQSPASPWDSLDLLSQWVSPEVWPRYEAAAIQVIEKLESQLRPWEYLRIHGDCHRGNLLFNQQFFFVDFDDSMMGPEVQDFWMLFQGQGPEERQAILQGYEELRQFPDEQWQLLPGLQGLRIISYSAWIARRWQDPSFPRLFPDFQTYTFWAEETEAIEKIAWSLD